MHVLPEILYSSSNSAESRRLSNLVKEGKIRKILPKAYTSNFDQTDEEIIQKHLLQLVSKHYPDTLLSHRSALEYEPTNSGNLYLTGSQNRRVNWPGITLRFSKGPIPLENDYPISESLKVSSRERALLENLSKSRKIDGEKKTVDEAILEEKLVLILETSGEKGLNEVRDQARVVAIKLQMEDEFEELNRKISAVLSTNPIDVLKSPLATAQALGEPYDPNRVRLFQKLAGTLNNTKFEFRLDNSETEDQFSNFAFFESYFSNYIEGTTFEIQEAIDIVYKNSLIPNRSADSHDIKGTFSICSDRVEMKRDVNSSKDFIDLLRERHSKILKGRPDKNPGSFKEKANRAGNTHFVIPRLVNGTLKIGFDMIGSIESGLGKAIFTMFMISEIHPFDDGNGRIARIMMNSELVKLNEQRIIVPTVFREDYLGALRRLTRRSDPSVIIRALNRTQEYSKWLSPVSITDLESQLTRSNAFLESNEGVLRWK